MMRSRTSSGMRFQTRSGLGCRPTGLEQIVPAVKGGARNANLFQRPPHWQGGLLDEPDDLKLLGGGVPHAASSPSAVTCFLSRRFSRVRSATTSRALLAGTDFFTAEVLTLRGLASVVRNSQEQKMGRSAMRCCI